MRSSGIGLTSPKIDSQKVIGALKATGSTYREVLYSRKEDLLAGTRRMKITWVAMTGAGARRLDCALKPKNRS